MAYYYEEDNTKEKHAHWIHKRVNSAKSVKGYFILPECRCSNCGAVATFERPKCQKCMAIMDEPAE